MLVINDIVNVTVVKKEILVRNRSDTMGTTGLTGKVMLRMEFYRDDDVYTGDLSVDIIGIVYTSTNTQ